MSVPFVPAETRERERGKKFAMTVWFDSVWIQLWVQFQHELYVRNNVHSLRRWCLHSFWARYLWKACLRCVLAEGLLNWHCGVSCLYLWALTLLLVWCARNTLQETSAKGAMKSARATHKDPMHTLYATVCYIYIYYCVCISYVSCQVCPTTLFRNHRETPVNLLPSLLPTLLAMNRVISFATILFHWSPDKALAQFFFQYFPSFLKIEDLGGVWF